MFERSLAEVEQDAPEDLAAQIRFDDLPSASLTDLGDLERARSRSSTLALGKADALTDAYSRGASLLGPRPPERPPGPTGRPRSTTFGALSRF